MRSKSKSSVSAKNAEELGAILGLSKRETALMKSKAQLSSMMAEAGATAKKAKGKPSDVTAAIKKTRKGLRF